PNTPHTRFLIGSITKTFTAALIMLLEKDGRLALTDGICKYLSPCPAGWDAIKLHHLLSHTSGIFNLTEVRDLEKQMVVPQTREEILARFEHVPLDFPPGTKFHYSNSNYYLLGMVIEQVTGKSYYAALRERILTPLGMSGTGLQEQGSIVKE